MYVLSNDYDGIYFIGIIMVIRILLRLKCEKRNKNLFLVSRVREIINKSVEYVKS